MAHTNGEWTAKGTDKNHSTWVECDGTRICTMKESDMDWGNAKLISAAPDLFYSLNNILNVIGAGIQNKADKKVFNDSASVIAAKAAIKKATE